MEIGLNEEHEMGFEGNGIEGEKDFLEDKWYTHRKK